MAGTSDEYVEVGASADSEDYQAFLDDYSNQFTPTEGGEALHARVLSVSEKEVVVDIGRKIEGLVPASQFSLVEGKPAVKPGDVIEVMFDRAGEPVVDGLERQLVPAGDTREELIEVTVPAAPAGFVARGRCAHVRSAHIPYSSLAAA